MAADVGSERESSGGAIKNVRLVGGSLYGVLSWALGFIAVGALFLDRVEDGALQFEQESGEFILDFFGWVYYAAHTVDVEVSGGGQTETLQIFEQFFIQDTLVFHAIPAILLFLSGYVVAARTGRSLTPGEGAIAGASVAIGYAVVTLVGVSFFAHQVGGISYEPPLQQAMVYVGVGYPVVFGGLGGFLRGA